MRIVLIGPVYPYKGGIAHYTSLLYKEISKNNDVTLISYKMQYPQILFHKEQKDYSNDLFKIDDVKFWINTANPANIINVAHRINKLEPQVAIIQWWHPYFAPCYKLLTAFLKKEIKVIYTCHNVLPHERFPFDKQLTKLIMNTGKGFIVHSKSDEKDLLSLNKNANIKYNPHPIYNVFKIRNINAKEAREEIYVNDRRLISEETCVLLFFGFVREYKGLKYLLEAMSEIKKRNLNCLLLIIGAFGEDKDEYIELINKLEINDLVYVRDDYTPDNEVERYFVASDLVVLPYENATQSGIVQIAYGFEKPCLVTNVGGLPDVVIDGKTGYVVEPCSPDLIANSISDFIINKKSEILIKGIKSEKVIFSWDKMGESIAHLYANEDSKDI